MTNGMFHRIRKLAVILPAAIALSFGAIPSVQAAPVHHSIHAAHCAHHGCCRKHGKHKMPLTCQIGSGAVALVQNPSISLASAGFQVSVTLTTPSTAGNALMLVVGFQLHAGVGVTGLPAGWVRLGQVTQSTFAAMEVWVYLNNPGGIQVVTFSVGVLGVDYPVGHLSEWSNVASAAALEASGTATATSGTTLVPTTSGNVLSVGDLALAGWFQNHSAGVATFTTPAAWTKLADNGTLSRVYHLDLEYQINPATGATLGPTLTSTATTNTAAGLIVVLKAAPPVTNQTAFLKYGSLAVKRNTADFQLIDPAVIPTLGDPVVFADPTWNGRMISVLEADIVDRPTGRQRVAL